MKGPGKTPEFCVLAGLMALVAPISVCGQGERPYSEVFEELQTAVANPSPDFSTRVSLDSIFDGAPCERKVLYAQAYPEAVTAADIKMERVPSTGLESPTFYSGLGAKP
jgi:hypothetical protein